MLRSSSFVAALVWASLAVAQGVPVPTGPVPAGSIIPGTTLFGCTSVGAIAYSTAASPTGTIDCANYLTYAVPTTLPTADGASVTSRNGTKTASDIYSPQVPAGYYFYDTVRSVLDLEAGTTVQQGAAFGAYTYNNNAVGSVGNEKNAVGFFAVGVNAINGSRTWGFNTACNDNTTNGLATLVGRVCIGYEADFQVNGASTVQGVALIIQGPGTPVNANGIQIGWANTGTAKWTNAFVTDDGAASVAAIYGATAVAAANVASQPIKMGVYDSSAIGHYISLQGISLGGGLTGLQFSDSGLANGLVMEFGATGSGPILFAAGSDTNMNFDLYAKGSGAIRFMTTTANITFNQAAPTVAAAQVGLGSTTAAAASCGAVATACLVINVAGTTRYVPYY